MMQSNIITKDMMTYVLGGGCFWCLDAVYRQVTGVQKVISGYAGGDEENPSYYDVAEGRTGHAEIVSVTFDETIISADTILDIFFVMHDPTTHNRQGADTGPQYRSIMLAADEQQTLAFIAARERAQEQWDDPIVTEITSLKHFYPAEDEHQDYFNKWPASGYCSIVIAPKLTTARKAYAKWFTAAV